MLNFSRKVLKGRIKFVYFILLILLNASVFANNELVENRKIGKVLLLNSYHKGYLWTDELTRGVEDYFFGKDVVLHVEYMDTKRQFDSTYQEILLSLLEYKHKIYNYDLVITSDNIAFDLLKEYREQLVGNTPIVFTGLNYVNDSDLEGCYNITGVNELANLVGNKSLIENLHPNCNRIIIITDNTATGKRVQQEAIRLREQSEIGQTQIELLYDVNSDELINKLQNLDSRTVVLFTFFNRDKDGVYFEYDQSAQLVCENSVQPVYGAWNSSLGFGIVGGYLANGYEQGRIAAEKAMKILAGVPASQIPIFNNPSTKLRFDYNQLKNKGISEKSLPRGSQIINSPLSFFQKNKKAIKVLLILFFILLLFALGLVYALSRSDRIKRELDHSRTQMSLLISNIPGVVYRCGSKGDWPLIFLSENIEKICGYPKEDFIENNSRDYSSIVYSDDLELVRDEIQNALDANVPWAFHYRIVHKDGTIHWVSENGRGVFDEDGQLIYLDGIILDITKRKEIEEEILLTNRKLKSTTESLKSTNLELTNAVTKLNKSKEVELLNEKLIRNEKILIKAHHNLKFKQEELNRVNLELKESHEETQQLNEELYANNEQLYSQNEELEATLHKLKETQAQLIQSEKMASAGVLIAGVAHEINNPLNFIQGGVSAIKTKIVSNKLEKYTKELFPLMDIIEDGVHRAANIVRSLNHFSRTSESFDEKCDLHAIVDNCLVMLMLNNESKDKVEIFKEFTTEECNLIGNEGKLHQVMLNILSNAQQAIETKGTIHISTTIINNKIILQIEDNGQGISEENLARIMDPFFTTKDPGQGTGLGLSIAYNVIKEHKGELSFSSELGKGTKVIISLPLKA